MKTPITFRIDDDVLNFIYQEKKLNRWESRSHAINESLRELMNLRQHNNKLQTV